VHALFGVRLIKDLSIDEPNQESEKCGVLRYSVINNRVLYQVLLSQTQA
jgi:hypothetical protein